MNTAGILPSVILAIACAALLPGTAAAGGRQLPAAPLFLLEAGIPWNALSPGEQQLLEQHRRNWSAYPPARQEKLRKGARKYLELSPRERDAVERKQQQYREMSPAEQRELREQYRKQKQNR